MNNTQPLRIARTRSASKVATESRNLSKLNFEHLKSFGSRSSKSITVPKLVDNNKEIMELLRLQVLPKLASINDSAPLAHHKDQQIQMLEQKIEALQEDNDFYQKRNTCLLQTIQKKELIIQEQEQKLNEFRNKYSLRKKHRRCES